MEKVKSKEWFFKAKRSCRNIEIIIICIMVSRTKVDFFEKSKFMWELQNFHSVIYSEFRRNSISLKSFDRETRYSTERFIRFFPKLAGCNIDIGTPVEKCQAIPICKMRTSPTHEQYGFLGPTFFNLWTCCTSTDRFFKNSDSIFRRSTQNVSTGMEIGRQTHIHIICSTRSTLTKWPSLKTRKMKNLIW